jgi:beta-xylosidase
MMPRTLFGSLATSFVAGMLGCSSPGGVTKGGGASTASGSGTSSSGYVGSGGAAASNSSSSSTSSGSSSTTGSSSSSSGWSGPWPPSTSFSNPVIWEDLADLDILRVDDTFYYAASTMHYSPGAPILRSFDLVNWEFAGHSVPVLDFSPKYDLNGGRAYVKGIWASFLNYRKSNQTWYWGGCIEFSKTYIFTATAVEGPWQEHPAINDCYYDAGLLIDDDDTMYVSYGGTTINVAQLSADGLSQVKTQAVFTSPSSVGTIEGSRFYKVNGTYYIFVDHPPDAEYVLKSSGGPFGPYTMQPLVVQVGSPVAGSGHPHQGGLVQLQDGDWYYMAFVDAYPGGRIPVLAPIQWSANGWPTVQLVANAWGAQYPYPNVPAPPRATKPLTGVDTFAGATLGPEWEWNHNPDNSKWSAGGKLTLHTATVTNDLYSARNTLTHRILGPTSTATIELDYGGMANGDQAGLVLLRDSSAWVGVKRSGNATKVTMVNNLTMDTNWNTTSTGTEVASAPVSGGKIWLRVSVDVHPGANDQGHFSYSLDGTAFMPIGTGFVMTNAWQFFMGYRFGIFNFATAALGGSVSVSSFTLTSP